MLSKERHQTASRPEFPILPANVWENVLDQYQSFSELTLVEVKRILEVGLSDVTDDQYNKLSSTQITAIAMVIECYWGRTGDQLLSLREAIGLVSQRPPFSVFSSDPATLEFWVARPVEWIEEGASGEIVLAHSEMPELMVKFRVSKKHSKALIRVEQLPSSCDAEIAAVAPYGGEDWTAVRRKVASVFCTELSRLKRC